MRRCGSKWSMPRVRRGGNAGNEQRLRASPPKNKKKERERDGDYKQVTPTGVTGPSQLCCQCRSKHAGDAKR